MLRSLVGSEMCIRDRNKRHLNLDNYNSIHLIISSCTQLDEERPSILFQDWLFDPTTYYIISSDCIVSPCFVVEDIDEDGNKRALVALDKDKWAAEFLDLADAL